MGLLYVLVIVNSCDYLLQWMVNRLNGLIGVSVAHHVVQVNISKAENAPRWWLMAEVKPATEMMREAH